MTNRQTVCKQCVRSCFTSGFIIVMLMHFYLTGCKREITLPGGEAGNPVVQERIYPVNIIPAGSQDIPYVIETTCSFFAEPDTDVSAEVDGRIQEILFVEGDAVSKGDTLILLDDERYQLQVEENLARLRLAKANLKNIAKELRRRRKLFTDGVISQQEYDDIINRMQVAVAIVKESRATLNIARKNLRDTRIKAPISGIISNKFYSTGEYVKEGDKLLNIVALDPIRIKTYLPEKYTPHIVTGKKVSVTVDAFPGETFHGEIYFVNPKVIVDTRRLECYARIPNSQLKLRPGFFGTARTVVTIHESAPVVPEEAILSENAEAYCYIAENGRAKKVFVKAGWRIEGGSVEILEGIGVGDPVIYRGQHALEDGDRVKVIEGSNR